MLNTAWFVADVKGGVQFMVDEMIKWCTNVAKNDFFTFICGMITIIGFLMTVYISVKTKSIHKRIIEYKQIEKYNENRISYIKSLKGYQTALIDGGNIRKVKLNILNDINIVRENYRNMFGIVQRIAIWRLTKELEKDKPIKEKVCNGLSKVIAVISVEKEQTYE